jgi:large subunit ribosomal protein L23Ae
MTEKEAAEKKSEAAATGGEGAKKAAAKGAKKAAEKKGGKKAAAKKGAKKTVEKKEKTAKKATTPKGGVKKTADKKEKAAKRDAKREARKEAKAKKAKDAGDQKEGAAKKGAKKAGKKAGKKATKKGKRKGTKTATYRYGKLVKRVLHAKKGIGKRNVVSKTAPVTAKGAKAAKSKALQALKAHKKGVRKTVHKVWHTVHFRRPHTLRLPRNPRYPRRSAPRLTKMDQYRILKYPLTTESAMKKIEDHNTLVFIVDLQANKHHISNAVKKMYNIPALRINTLVRADGYKKAFVRLPEDYDALDVANKIGII